MFRNIYVIVIVGFKMFYAYCIIKNSYIIYNNCDGWFGCNISGFT